MSILGVGSLAFGQTFAIDSTLLTPPRRPAPASWHARVAIPMTHGGAHVGLAAAEEPCLSCCCRRQRHVTCPYGSYMRTEASMILVALVHFGSLWSARPGSAICWQRRRRRRAPSRRAKTCDLSQVLESERGQGSEGRDQGSDPRSAPSREPRAPAAGALAGSSPRLVLERSSRACRSPAEPLPSPCPGAPRPRLADSLPSRKRTCSECGRSVRTRCQQTDHSERKSRLEVRSRCRDLDTLLSSTVASRFSPDGH